MVGEEGRGVRTIIDMVNHTRLDCVIGSASLMRQAVAQATHHTAHRSAFGKLLSEQPLMVNVLADLAVESEATTMLMMRLAGAFDDDGAARHFRRLAAGGREVLVLQARDRRRGRSARVPRRQRLRRGVDPAAPVP